MWIEVKDNGKICVEIEVWTGTTFYISLPSVVGKAKSD